MLRADGEGLRTVQGMDVFPTGSLTLVGHRGLGRGTVHVDGVGYRENSVASHVKAAELGCEWVEADVVATLDGHLVMNHDTVLPDGRGVSSLTLSEMLAEGLDTLDDLFETLPEHVGVLVEVKPVRDDLPGRRAFTTAGLAVSAVAREMAARPLRPFLSHGFDPSLPLTLARAAKELGIDLPTSAIAEDETSLVALTLGAVELGAKVVAGHTTSFLGETARHLQLPDTLPEVLAAGHAAGVQYLCWCPDLDSSVQLAAAGVDAVCIDDVPQAVKRLKGLRTGEGFAALPLQRSDSASLYFFYA